MFGVYFLLYDAVIALLLYDAVIDFLLYDAVIHFLLYDAFHAMCMCKVTVEFMLQFFWGCYNSNI